MAEIDPSAWNRLALQNPTPFYEWEWLHLLEESGSMTPETGWTPVHLTVWKGGLLIGCAPLYIKTHSMGEFVYDFAWADVASKLNQPYYPKLVGTSPATPSGAYQYLVDPRYPQVERLMTEQIIGFVQSNELGGVSFLFTDQSWGENLRSQGFGEWKHQSYLWENQDFGCFDDYLACFSKGQRRNIKRETASVQSQGFTVDRIFIENSDYEDRQFVHAMYEKTNRQFGPWAAKFLTPGFFLELNRIPPQRVLLFMAKDAVTRQRQALSLVVIKGDRMYGRYWGTRSFVKNLHFVLCYYEPIRYAVEEGIRFFDPGAGSPHKLRRGFKAVTTSSLHYFQSEIMNRVFSTYIPEVNQEEQLNIDYMNSAVPMKSTDSL